MTARMTSLARDARGVAAVEFAILAPIVAVLATLGYAGLALHAGAVALETGAAAAARFSVLGDSASTAAGDATRMAAIRRIVTEHVCPAGGGFCYWSVARQVEGADGVVSPLGLEMRAYVDPRNLGRPEPFTDKPPYNGRHDPGEIYVDVNGNGRWDADMGVAGPGGSGDYVLFTLSIAQEVRHPLLTPVMGARLIHQAQVLVRNEPF